MSRRKLYRHHLCKVNGTEDYTLGQNTQGLQRQWITEQDRDYLRKGSCNSQSQRQEDANGPTSNWIGPEEGYPWIPLARGLDINWRTGELRWRHEHPELSKKAQFTTSIYHTLFDKETLVE